ncbi:MAG: Hydrogen cyanide synthase subunit HcnA [candidate division WS2 bacterium]|nr:Hydrogen cyanide synthase subunit HcnA [Candidatus Lithacetigena glycinireducens]MBT9175307.1 Hydrogen cyanide synthase subunit HcnA [Candidatus Lithacetigena glycinireducens]
MRRIQIHPILKFDFQRPVVFTYNGKELTGFAGDTVASALIACGITTFHHSHKLYRPRGFFCAIGNCSSCLMEVDGIPNTRICIVPLKEGMVVNTQVGKGRF